jgi:hypothetical protein
MDAYGTVGSKKGSPTRATAHQPEPVRDAERGGGGGGEWGVGDECRAAWSEDGEVYNARIDSVDRASGTCIVTFTDYGNTDVVNLTELMASIEGDGDEADTPLDLRVLGTALPLAPQPHGHWDGPAMAAHELPRAHVATSHDRSSARGSARAEGRRGMGSSARWTVGDRCRCIYRTDGLVYSGEIIEVAPDGLTCGVVFDGYGNTQFDTPVAHVYPPEDQQPPATPRSHAAAHHPSHAGAAESRYYGGAAPGSAAPHHSHHPHPPHPPHPPHHHRPTGHGRAEGPPPLDDSLASMLMSWYQSGFQTGYYLAQQELRRPPY